MTSMAASRIRWYLSEVPLGTLAAVSVGRFTMEVCEFTWIRMRIQPRFSTLRAIPLKELAKGAATVAVLRFFFGWDFSEGFTQRGKVEQRVITEPVAAAWSRKQLAGNFALEDRERDSVSGSYQDAD